MEFLLLWIDELDDALGALRHLAPKIAGFCLAVALFALTGFALVVAPHTTLAIAGVVLTATLFEFARKRRRTLQKN
jgi:Flp pilus assembly protein TadB